MRPRGFRSSRGWSRGADARVALGVDGASPWFGSALVPAGSGSRGEAHVSC